MTYRYTVSWTDGNAFLTTRASSKGTERMHAQKTLTNLIKAGEKLHLGIIYSTDNGKTWRTVS